MPERRNRRGTVKRAKALRRAMTDAERKLWFRLNYRQLGKHAFRKQVPIDSYIADFACLRAHLVIEVDGGQHDRNKAADDARTAWLQRRGYRVLRFWNNEVLQNIEDVIETIARAVGMQI